MKKHIAWAVPIALLLAAATAPAQEPCPSCKFAERGDRSEGIEDREQISGGSFELLSVHYLTRGGPSAGDRIHVYFWVPEAGTLDELKVWQPGRYYRMEPRQRQYEPGLRGFSWSRGEVIDPMGLAIDSLYARVRAGDTFLPALVTTGEPEVRQAGYAFVFESGAGIDADCTIAAAASGAAVKTFECYEEYGGEITIEWDGRDESGGAAADGTYTLQIEGDMLAEIIRPLETNVTFRHRSRLR